MTTRASWMSGGRLGYAPEHFSRKMWCPVALKRRTLDGCERGHGHFDVLLEILIEITEPEPFSLTTLSRVVAGSIFDLPAVYHAVFDEETEAEAQRLERFLVSASSGPLKRIFAPGCGCGRLLRWFQDQGWTVCGLDKSRAAVAYANHLLDASLRAMDEHCSPVMGDLDRNSSAHRSPEASVVVGDMRAFDRNTLGTNELFDAAFCSVNTIRHLASDAAVRQHLASMASVIRPGGVYVIELELTEAFSQSTDAESLGNAGGAADALIWCKGISDREETFGTLVTLHDGSFQYSVEGEVVYRTYTRSQAVKLFNSTEQWTILDECSADDGGPKPIGDRCALALRRV